MGTAKITQTGLTFTVEDVDDEIHSGLSLKEAAELLDVEEEDVLDVIANGQGGVGYIDVDDEEEELNEDEEEEEDK
jgi:hypothetical protein